MEMNWLKHQSEGTLDDDTKNEISANFAAFSKTTTF